MSDMPERVWVRWMETYIEQSDEGDPCAYEYIRADKYADLERQHDKVMSDYQAHLAMVASKERPAYDEQQKRIADLERQRDGLVELATTLMSYAAKDEDESKSILGYVIYAPPWLIRDLEVALAKAEKDDE